MATENKKMQQRRDTAANWTSNNPTLSAGEIGFETDTGKFKIGDGSTAWNSIANYFDDTPATATNVLTGTSATTFVTPDALAALWEQGSDIASAGTISVGEGGYFHVTGTTTITDIDFATDKAGRKVWLKFNGVLTLTHNATTLILPGGANITTAAGDIACFVSEGSDNVRCISYTRASGEALVGSGGSEILSAYLSADDVFTSDDTLGNTGLNVTVEAGGVYDVDIQFTFDNGAGWFKFDLNGGTATMTNVRLFAISTALTGSAGSPLAASTITSIATSVAFGTVEEVKGVQIRGCVEINAAGTFIMRAAQFSSNGDPTTIYRGATMKLTKLN